MSLRAQSGKSPLPQGFIHPDRHRVGKIQRTGVVVIQHRETHTAVPVFRQQLFRQASRLFAENQISAIRICQFRVYMGGFGRKIEKRARIAGKKIFKGIILSDIQQMPVIQPRPFELSIINGETHGTHQMQP